MNKESLANGIFSSISGAWKHHVLFMTTKEKRNVSISRSETYKIHFSFTFKVWISFGKLRERK
jgi:hypothetical protein